MCSITIYVVVYDIVVSNFIITCVVLIYYLCHCDDIHNHYSTIYYCHHSLHYLHSNDHHSFITLMNNSPLLSISNALSHQPIIKVYQNVATPISAITLSSPAFSIVVEIILLYITQSIIIMIIAIID